MSDVREIIFSKAETKRLRELAQAANQAQEQYWTFVGFLYEQHEVRQEDGWQIGQRGFELHVPPEAGSGERETQQPIAAPPVDAVPSSNGHSPTLHSGQDEAEEMLLSQEAAPAP